MVQWKTSVKDPSSLTQAMSCLMMLRMYHTYHTYHKKLCAFTRGLTGTETSLAD